MIKKKLAGIILTVAAANFSSTATYAMSHEVDANKKYELLEINKKKSGNTFVELESLLDEIDKLNTIDYTENSWKELFNVRDKIIEKLILGYSNEEINTLYEELKLAKENLEPVVDYNKIETIIDNWYELKEYLYSGDTWKALEEEISKAELIINNDNLTKAEVDNFSANLEKVFYNLNLREEKQKLAKLVAYADLIKDINFVITAEQKQLRWYNFENIRELTKETLFDPNNNKAENESAYMRLKFFIEELGINVM